MKRISPSKSLVLSVVFIAATLACAPVFAAKKNNSFDDMSELDAMSDQLDQLDKQDFQEAVERATSCTRKRDFFCAESELAKAAKAANDGKDKKILLASRQSLANEKQELANEQRRAEEARRREEEERQARIRREEEADREWEERRRRAEQAEDSSYSASNDIGMYILQKGQENAAILSNLNRQTTAAYAETNRRLAAQAAERERAKAERDEREAERRRDARRSEEARQSRERLAQADARDREDLRRKEAERAAVQQREEQRRKDQKAQQERTRVSVSSSASTATGSNAQKDGATKNSLPHKPYAEPNPYDKGFFGGNTEVGKEAGWSSHSAGNGQTREAACSEARKRSQQEIARLSAHWRFDATSPCVCSVNVGADRSMLDAMAETGEPDHWFCAMYEKKTQIRDLGSRSR